MAKVYSEIPPHPPIYGKLQIWDDQSLLRNTPHAPHYRKTSDLGWPKFTPKYPPTHPPIMENFRFGMTKVYSEIPPTSPHYGNLQIWDDQSLLRNTPSTLWKTSDLGWPKFTPKYPPHFGNLQIWDDQSLLWNTPPPHLWKTSDSGWPKFTLKYPPSIMENFRFGMTKVYSEIPPHPPPHFGKLQIWDDQSLLRNTPPPPPIMENFRFGMTKVYSEIPPSPHFGKLQIWDDQSLLRNSPPPPHLWKTSDLGWPKFTPK